jgi:DNA (cytosine-5)-methyltransferase 1
MSGTEWPGVRTVGSLFAGIGGFDLGFERAGFETVWQVEIDEYCRRVLERHFPRAERFGDIRECGKHNLKTVDVICGGFPCQDISAAGKRVGIGGERSGLWAEMFRVIGELRPRFAVVENVSDLLVRGIERVVGDLASIGYDAEWDSVRAHDVGAPHLRERVLIVAYPGSVDGQTRMAQKRSGSDTPRREISQERSPYWFFSELGAQTSARIQAWISCEPCLGRMANGIPNRVHRVSALGNAIVPAKAQWIAERIKAVMEGTTL